MEKNNIIIIALIATIAVLGVCIGYALMNPQVEYETINISNGTTIDVPKANDVSWTVDPNGIKTYACQSKHTVMMTFNSQEDLNLVGAGAFALARDALINGSTDVEKYKSYEIKENTVNGTHYYITYISSNETHDNIVIGSENLDILKHMLDSLRLGPPGESVANATMNQTQTSSSSSNTESGQYGYCAICGKALTYAEAHSEHSQGKVCHSCAANPYYQTPEGAEYANQKLYEAYPDEYEWMYEDTDDSAYDDSEYYDDSNYEDEEN